MKLFLLTAAAVIATPVLAQQQSSTSATPPTSSTDSMQTPPSQMPSGSMSGQTMSGQTMPAQATGGEPIGGYQPATPALSGPVQPGATVTFQQAPSPDQAYPAPAPLAHYPPCKPGQYDNCMQVSGSREHHAMRHRRHK